MKVKLIDNNNPQCKSVKMYLNMKGIEYETINYDDLEESEKQSIETLPIVYIEDKDILLSGFNPQELDGVFKD